MGREFFGHNNSQWLLTLLKKIIASPEFYFAEGDFFSKLEHVCYYHLGSFQYPAKLLLKHIFDFLAEKYEVAVTVQDIRLRIVKAPVYKIASDGAIMAQDINHVIGPIEELMEEKSENELEKEFERTLAILEKFQPHELGEVLVSSPEWCKASYLIEAVIYEFEKEEISNENIIRSILKKCLMKSNGLKMQKLAIEALGTEYKILTPHTFVQILHDTLIKLAGHLKYLKELIIVAHNQKHVNALKKAFSDVLNIKIP